MTPVADVFLEILNICEKKMAVIADVFLEILSPKNIVR